MNVTLAIRSAIVVHSPKIIISIPELKVESRPLSTIPVIPASTTSPTFLSAQFLIPDHVPQRWFPHNLGTPKLYNVTISLMLSENNSGSTSGSVGFTTRTGFRTIELVQTRYSQEEIDERGITPGDQWHFEINGKAFYSSGTNIIVRHFFRLISFRMEYWLD